jgi:hypothetical protein
MRYISAIALFLLLIVCIAGIWFGRQARTAEFVADGGRDVQVRELGLGERLITYRMPGPDVPWLSDVARRLGNNGWRISDERYQWGATENYSTIYTRTTDLWIFALHEQAELVGDRGVAQIRVRYVVRR